MTTELILVTQQTTNLLVDSVNARQSEGYLPACGLLNFNARYTQLMARDLANPKQAKCPYFIIDGTDGADFAEKANRVLAQIPNAACLGNVLYAASRYIQAWGDDAFHSGGGGHSGSVSWDDVTDKPAFIAAAGSEEAARAIIDAASTAVATQTTNGLMSAADKTKLDGMTGGLPWYSEGDISGVTTPIIKQASGIPAIIIDGSVDHQAGLVFDVDGDTLNSAPLWINATPSEWSIASYSPGMGRIVNEPGDLRIFGGPDATRGSVISLETVPDYSIKQATITSDSSSLAVGTTGVNVVAQGVSCLNSTGTETHLIAQGSHVLLGPDYATMNSSNAYMTMSEDDGLLLNRDGVDILRANDMVLQLTGPGNRTTSNIHIDAMGCAFRQDGSTGLSMGLDQVGLQAKDVVSVGAMTGTATLSSSQSDVHVSATSGHIFLNALGQSMTIGPAGLRYAVDGHDVITTGGGVNRDFPQVTLTRPMSDRPFLNSDLSITTLSQDTSELRLTNGSAELGSNGTTTVKGGQLVNLTSNNNTGVVVSDMGTLLFGANNGGSELPLVTINDTVGYLVENNRTKLQMHTVLIDPVNNNRRERVEMTSTTDATEYATVMVNNRDPSDSGQPKAQATVMARDSDNTSYVSVFGSGIRLGSTTIIVDGDTYPADGVTASLGTLSNKWSVVYADTGTINTSDRNMKKDITAIPDAVLDAWEDVEYCQYRFTDGDRLHTGVIAQQIEEAFKARGLDAREYGVLCVDEVDGVERYGVRYEEALVLEAACMRRWRKK